MIMMCIRKWTWLVVFLYSFLVRVILLIDDLRFAVEAGARMRGRNLRCSPSSPRCTERWEQAGRRPLLLLPTAAAVDAASVAAGFHSTLFASVRIQTNPQRAGLNFCDGERKRKKKNNTDKVFVSEDLFLARGLRGRWPPGSLRSCRR